MHSLQVLMQENRAARLGSRLSRTQRSASSTDYPASTDALIGTPPHLRRYASFRRITAVRLPKEHRQYDASRDENRGTDSSNPLPSSVESANHRFLSSGSSRSGCRMRTRRRSGLPYARWRSRADYCRCGKADENSSRLHYTSVILALPFHHHNRINLTVVHRRPEWQALQHPHVLWLSLGIMRARRASRSR